MGKRKNNSLYFVVLFFIISIILVALAFYLQSSLVVKRMEIPVYLGISNVTGLQVTNESLDFGRITYDSAATKKIDLSNNYNFSVNIFFNCEGKACPFLTYEEKTSLEPGEKKVFSVSTITFTNESYGKYYGKMKVVFKKKIN